MARLRVVADADVPLELLADRLRTVGHWVPPEALEHAVDAAIAASPPALLDAVRTHLRSLGSTDGAEERRMFAGALRLFAERAPRTLARLEAALDAGDEDGAGAAARRLARQAEVLGALPLARLCSLPPDRAALRRELVVTCRVLLTVAAELEDGAALRAVADPGERRDAGA